MFTTVRHNHKLPKLKDKQIASLGMNLPPVPKFNPFFKYEANQQSYRIQNEPFHHFKPTLWRLHVRILLASRDGWGGDKNCLFFLKRTKKKKEKQDMHFSVDMPKGFNKLTCISHIKNTYTSSLMDTEYII